MKKQIARKLIKALESGEWKSCKGQLGRGTKMRCCLGVLQEIAPPEISRCPLDEGSPDIGVLNWAGLEPETWKYVTETSELAALNDENPGYSGPLKYLKEKYG